MENDDFQSFDDENLINDRGSEGMRSSSGEGSLQQTLTPGSATFNPINTKSRIGMGTGRTAFADVTNTQIPRNDITVPENLSKILSTPVKAQDSQKDTNSQRKEVSLEDEKVGAEEANDNQVKPEGEDTEMIDTTYAQPQRKVNIRLPGTTIAVSESDA